MRLARTDTTGRGAGENPAWRLLVATAALLCLAGAAAAEVPGLELAAQEADTLALAVPGAVVGLAWIGPDTLAVLTDIPDTVAAGGRREVRLVFQDRNGRVLLDEDFSGVLDRALAYDGQFLWSAGDADDGSSILYKLKVDTLRVEESFDLPGHRPTGMCFDGEFVWVGDRDSGRLDRFDPQTKSVTRSVLAPGFSPVGLAWDGRDMWVTDAGTGRLDRLSGARRRWTATLAKDSFRHRGEDILLMHDGFSLWYVPVEKQIAIRLIFP